jgi:hypothetical protein
MREKDLIERMDREIDAADAWLEQQHRDFRNHMATIDKARAENRGRNMLLTAGILGVVVPLLANHPGLVVSSRLKYASICWLVALSIAVFGQALDRLTLKWITDAFNTEATTAYEARLPRRAAMLQGVNPPAPSSLAELNHTQALAVLERKRDLRRWIANGEDVLVYGAFIAGVILLVFGLR